MNAVQEELFDLALLRVLDANRTRWGMGVEAIIHLLAEFGFPSSPRDTVLDRLDYQTRKLHAEEVLKTSHAANRAWRITEAGIRYLDAHP